MPDPTERLVVLLRGVNVGGHNRLPMKDFAAALEDAGCVDVKTYIQSGNAVVRVPHGPVEALATRIRQCLAERCSVDVPVVLRSAEAMARAAAAHPLTRDGDTHRELYVGFLSADPGPRADDIAALSNDVDTALLVGDVLFLRYGMGAGRSRLTTAVLDRTLGVVTTLRNWRTTVALAELAAG